MNRFVFNFFLFVNIYKYSKIHYQGELSIFINRIFRNTFPVKLYYDFSLVNWTAATESATSYEHAHCAWYG